MKPGLRKVVHYVAELKRRKVFRTTVAYASAAVVIALGVAQLYDVLLLPDWTPRLVIVLLVAGLPVAVALSWAYDIRSEASTDSDAVPAATPVAVAPAASPAAPEPSIAVDPGKVTVTGRQYHEVTEHELLITADVCRRLDRRDLDARIIGDHLHYSDNHADSDILVCYLHNFGGDHHVWETVLEESPYRGVAPTLYGFERSRARPRTALSLKDHLTLLEHFVQEVLREIRPETFLLVGFSSGADVGFQLLAGRPTAEPAPVDGFLALGVNLSRDTCFVSGALAQEASAGDANLLAELRKAGTGATSLGEWLNLHEYLVMILRKFHPDLAPLRRHGQDIVGPFLQDDDVFSRWFRGASERVGAVRCVFADTEMETIPAQRILLEHLDTSVLGPHFREGGIVIEPGADHLDLKASKIVHRHVAELVAALGHR